MFDSRIQNWDKVCIRQPGGFTYVGKLVSVDALRIVLVDVAWVAVSGRWAAFLADGKASSMEIEPWPDGVEVSLPLHQCEVSKWDHPLLRETV